MLSTVLLELFVRIIVEGPAMRNNTRAPITVAPTITARTVAKEPRWFVLEEPLVVPFAEYPPSWRGVDSPSSIVAYVIVVE